MLVRKLVVPASIVIAALVTALPASAGDCPDHRNQIDIDLDRTLEGDLSTADTLAAIADAHEQWDAVLNQRYRELMAELPDPVKSQLRDSQRAWLRFRDAEHEALVGLYENTEGSLFRPMQALDRLRQVKHRAEQLDGWLDTWRLRNQ